MRKALFPLLLAAALSTAVHAQNGQYPPVILTQPSGPCDTRDWKLVLFDEFSDDRLDTSKWNPHLSWLNMTRTVNNQFLYGDHDNWDEAYMLRDGDNPAIIKTIFKKENVEVSNGMLLLKLMNERHSWTLLPRHPECSAAE